MSYYEGYKQYVDYFHSMFGNIPPPTYADWLTTFNVRARQQEFQYSVSPQSNELSQQVTVINHLRIKVAHLINHRNNVSIGQKSKLKSW